MAHGDPYRRNLQATDLELELTLDINSRQLDSTRHPFTVTSVLSLSLKYQRLINDNTRALVIAKGDETNEFRD
jgi:hypothetical protein